MDRNQNARIAAGDDRLLSIAVANPSGADLTGLQARYILARSAYDPRPPLISKTTGAGITISTSNVPPGYALVLQVTLANDDTALLDPGWYYHEASIEQLSGAVSTVMNGQVRLDPTAIASLM